jgi:acetolactate synthase-1/2/3 large subunit
VLVTSGPGATNAVTGITDALMDSIPMVVHHRPGADASDRHDAFQECRHRRHHAPCTKHNYLVKDAQARRCLHEAFHIATTAAPARSSSTFRRTCSSPPAPIIRRGPIEHITYRPQVKADAGAIDAAVEMLAAAEAPILYTGGGVINSGPEARAAARAGRLTGAPVTSTLMGLGAFRPPIRSMAGHAGHARHL